MDNPALPGSRKESSPIDQRYRPYNTVRTNVLHCDKADISSELSTHAVSLSIIEIMPMQIKRNSEKHLYTQARKCPQKHVLALVISLCLRWRLRHFIITGIFFQHKRLFQCGSQEAGLVKYDIYTCKNEQ